MAHKVETMAWANEVPWHGLGDMVDGKQTPAQMCKASKTNWTVSKQALYVMKGGKHVAVPGEFALMRDSDGTVFDIVGDVYKPVQNEQVFEFFKKFCDAGHMTMETAGSLWGGRYVWVLARINKDFAIGKTDEVRPYLLIMSPHQHGKSLLMQYTAIRVVCWNTLTMAIGASLKGDGQGFRMPHSQAFDVKKEEAEKVLKLMVDQTAEFKQASELLAKKKVTKEKVEQFFIDVLSPKKTDDKSEEKETKRTPVLLPKFRAALEHAPGAQLATAKGTWWGALNAVTYIIDHEVGSDRQTALKGAWLGNHANTKRRALAMAIERAK